MEESREIIADVSRYCPICDGKHKMPLTKKVVTAEYDTERKIKYIEIFNYCKRHDYELGVCKQLSINS